MSRPALQAYQPVRRTPAVAEHTPLDGRAAIVTGASAGIGEATAHALAREGARVALAARRDKFAGF